MSMRKKLNGLYLTGCAAFGTAVGLVFHSWAAGGTAFAAAAVVQLAAGNIRLAPARR